MKINLLEEIKLGGIKQWIYLAGKDADNPILLVLHGGPGFVMMPLFHLHNAALEDKFTIVQWDQRGAGKSYSKDIPLNTMTLNQFIDDAHELTLFLKSRFKKQKIYVLGHSSGSMIGILLAEKYPQDYSAYIGVGQVISFVENEQGSYDYALNQAQQRQHKAAINQLTHIGRPNHKGEYRSDEGYDITSNWVETFGGSLHKANTLDALYDELFESDLYQNDNKKILKGYEFSQNLFNDKHMLTFDVAKEAASLDLPVYFISGKYDYDTPVDLVKKYYEYVSAPRKKFIQFEHSAHFPFYEEAEEFNRVMIESILAEIYRVS